APVRGASRLHLSGADRPPGPWRTNRAVPRQVQGRGDLHALLLADRTRRRAAADRPGHHEPARPTDPRVRGLTLEASAETAGGRSAAVALNRQVCLLRSPA